MSTPSHTTLTQQLQSLQARIDRLEKRCEVLTNERDESHRELDEQNNTISALKNENRDLKRQLQDVEYELEESRAFVAHWSAGSSSTITLDSGNQDRRRPRYSSVTSPVTTSTSSKGKERATSTVSSELSSLTSTNTMPGPPPISTSSKGKERATSTVSNASFELSSLASTNTTPGPPPISTSSKGKERATSTVSNDSSELSSLTSTNTTPGPPPISFRKVTYIGAQPSRQSTRSSSTHDDKAPIPNPTKNARTSRSVGSPVVDISSGTSSGTVSMPVNGTVSSSKPLKRKRTDTSMLSRGGNVKHARIVDLVDEEDVVIRDCSPEIQFLGSSPARLSHVKHEVLPKDEPVVHESRASTETPLPIDTNLQAPAKISCTLPQSLPVDVNPTHITPVPAHQEEGSAATSLCTPPQSLPVTDDSALTTPMPDNQEEGSSTFLFTAKVEEEKKLIIKPESSKKEEASDSESKHALSKAIPLGSSIGVPRKFFTDVYGLHGVQIRTKVTRNNLTQPTLAPTLKKNPFIPSSPGKPGKIYGGRNDCLGTFTVLIPVRNSKPALWQYAGEYRTSIKGALTAQQFRAESQKFQDGWADTILNKTWPTYVAMRTRIALRNRGMQDPSDADVELEQERTKKTGLGLKKPEVLKALREGKETVKIIDMEFIGYDQDFANEIRSKFATWVPGSGKTSQNPKKSRSKKRQARNGDSDSGTEYGEED